MDQKRKWKFLFYAYIGTAVFFIMGMNYFDSPISGYSNEGSGTVSIRLKDSTCGDGFCTQNETWLTCCSDCGCPEYYVCFDNECAYQGGKRSSSRPIFEIFPREQEYSLGVNEIFTIDYTINNLDKVPIYVNLGVSDGGVTLTLNETTLLVEPGKTDIFEVTISTFSIDTGIYQSNIVAISGLTNVSSKLTVFVQPSLFLQEAGKIDKSPRFQFSFIWLLIPISIAGIVFIYVYRHQSTNVQ